MKKRTQLVGSDAYEDLASAYQLALVSMLDQALRESGISPKRKRRQICERFMRSHGVLHDQCWLRSRDQTVYPLLGFSEVFQNIGMSHQQLGTVIVDKDKSFSYDEYLWSVLRCYFEPDETVPSVEVGLVGEEAADGDEQEGKKQKKKKPRRG
ncbi:MAG TPA: hypothetical protein VE999_05030 [Gemmataceae bacterium]|nr:hypothetical protein [Gemmataceae bacterium]